MPSRNNLAELYIITDIENSLGECKDFNLMRIHSEYCKYFSIGYKMIKKRSEIIDFIIETTPVFGSPGLVDFISHIIKNGMLKDIE